MKVIKGIINVLTTLIIIIGGIFLILYICGIVPYVVLSGSMEPTIETGSVCFINRHAKYNSIKSTKSLGSYMKPYYTMVKTSDGDKLGLVQIYTPDEKQNIISYLVL